FISSVSDPLRSSGACSFASVASAASRARCFCRALLGLPAPDRFPPQPRLDWLVAGLRESLAPFCEVRWTIALPVSGFASGLPTGFILLGMYGLLSGLGNLEFGWREK